MANLPKWVWDLVIHLQQQEDEHPTLYIQANVKNPAPADKYIESDWCPARALDQVPRPIRKQAEAIREYTQMAEQDKSEGSDD